MDLDINNHIEVLQDHEQNFKDLNKPVRLAEFSRISSATLWTFRPELQILCYEDPDDKCKSNVKEYFGQHLLFV